MKALFTLLGSLLVGGLVLLGIGGVAYHLFRDNGWLSQGMGALFSTHPPIEKRIAALQRQAERMGRV